MRPSRIAVVRMSYPQLVSTTIRDFNDVLGSVSKTTMGHPPTAHIEFSMADGTTVKSDLIFLAAERDDDVKKIRGLQLTFAWLNEANQLSKSVVDMIEGRLGRYPSRALAGVECTHSRIIGDLNPPEDDHWIAQLYNKPEDGFNVWKQPPAAFKTDGVWGVNPVAENIKNLPARYYHKLLRNRKEDWIRVNVGNEFGSSFDGKPIYPEYAAHVHQDNSLEFVPGYPLLVGVDFGTTPAVVLAQNINDQLRVFDEIVEERAGALQLGRKLKVLLNAEYPESAGSLSGWGDPAGEQGSQTDLTTPFMMLHSLKLNIHPANTNDFTLRREAVADRLSRLNANGMPRVLIGARCVNLRKAMSGGYHFKRIRAVGKEGAYKDKPDKDKYSHIAEALQYLSVSIGDGYSVLGGDDWGRELEHAEREMDWGWLNDM